MTLEQRDPGQALRAMVPEPQPPADVNLFGARLGDTFERRFDPARLRRRCGPSIGPDNDGQEATS
ncbi:hypothetical protein HHL19_35535 [Streptomyces sp. R302]|uniref:hypothetical protein n=1 Tax=unclassified Streptomyces TaxID=2593676 RepID=UPI00145C82CF|nr:MULTISPECIES: hypothetical protein [unclassified Streptomyces]NML55147.1 hypothetical protein [Streptomyces sp. R301]NML83823.1 hypothetical protein [Streptomyces sp. R302]